MTRQSNGNIRWGRRVGDERGAALITALMAMLLLTALGLALVLTTTTETMIAGNFRNGQEALYAADAGLERSMQDLLTVPDWNTILAGGHDLGLHRWPGQRDPQPARRLGARSHAGDQYGQLRQDVHLLGVRDDHDHRGPPVGPEQPPRTLYAYGPVNDLVPTGTVNSPMYVVVWVCDDQSENDNDPTKDGNAQTNPGTGVLALRAEAFGPSNTHKVIEVTVARTNSIEIQRGYTGQRGQDEQNRRARKAAVQTPGRALSGQQLATATGVIG